MNFIYTPLDGMKDTINKYDIDFKAGESVDVIDLVKVDKLRNAPYMSVCAEVEESKQESKPKRKRRTPAEMEAARQAYDNASE